MKYLTMGDRDYKYMLISNSRGKLDHVAMFDPSIGHFRPVCNSKVEDIPGSLESRRYILSETPTPGVRPCRKCLIRLLENDLVDFTIKFDRHLVLGEKGPNDSVHKKAPIFERGMTPVEYKRHIEKLAGDE